MDSSRRRRRRRRKWAPSLPLVKLARNSWATAGVEPLLIRSPGPGYGGKPLIHAGSVCDFCRCAFPGSSLWVMEVDRNQFQFLRAGARWPRARFPLWEKHLSPFSASMRASPCLTPLDFMWTASSLSPDRPARRGMPTISRIHTPLRYSRPLIVRVSRVVYLPVFVASPSERGDSPRRWC